MPLLEVRFPTLLFLRSREALLTAYPPVDTTAIGVFVITIHYAEDLSAQDSNGKSDPYVVLAYAKVRSSSAVSCLLQH